MGNVLKASADSSMGMQYLIHGGVVGLGLGFSPARVAAGYIVGLRVTFSILVGIVIGWGSCGFYRWHGSYRYSLFSFGRDVIGRLIDPD